MFSRRTQRSLSSNALALAVERQPPRWDLTVSNPTLAGLSETFELPPASTYAPEPFGLISAREEVTRWYGAGSAGQVVLSASSSEAYSWLMQLTGDAGDEWLAPAPCYPLLDELARLSGVELARYPLRFDGEWTIDFAALEPAGPRVKAVVVVAPGNPTGHYPSEEEWARLERLCASRGWALVVDEVFASPGRSRVGVEPKCLRFVLGGLSKAVGQPQLKLSWMVVQGPGAQEALSRLEWIADAFLSVATPVQLALPRILARSAAFRERVEERRVLNLAALKAACPPELSVLPSLAGWSAVVRVPAVPDEETRCLRWLERGVLVQPGFFYDFPSGHHVVLSLIVEPAAFTAALEALFTG
ncbi:MAG: pyridoxal phosphate-dependent aminotransferase [Myxococcaceae bacterium]